MIQSSPNPHMLSWSFLRALQGLDIVWNTTHETRTTQRVRQVMVTAKLAILCIHYVGISHVTFFDMLMRHFRKMVLYVRRYRAAYRCLISTSANIQI